MAPLLNLTLYPDDGRQEVLQRLIDGHSPPQMTAEALASISIKAKSLQNGFGSTWDAIFQAARTAPQHQEKLVDVLVCISNLPPAKVEEADGFNLQDGCILRSNMLTLGWLVRDEWDGKTCNCRFCCERKRKLTSAQIM